MNSALTMMEYIGCEVGKLEGVLVVFVSGRRFKIGGSKKLKYVDFQRRKFLIANKLRGL